MANWTKLEIVTKVELDLDLQEETIVTSSEMDGYINAAIRDARAIIETMEEDYFLKSAALTMVQGADSISLPADCYASKIRSIIYDEGNNGTYYEVKRVRDLNKFLKAVSDSRGSTDEPYRYFITDFSATAGVKIKLTRVAAVSSAALMTVWYRRDANVLSLDADVCDIPEFIDYILAHTKRSCLAKMNNGIAPPEANADVAKEEKRMVETLTKQTADTDDTLDADYTHYEEST